MIFYRDVSEAGFDIAPNQAMHSLHKVLRKFKMPGYTIPDFRRKAVTIAVGGVYDPRIHLDDIVMPVPKKWRIFEREDFTGEAARMRDDLGLLVEELRRRARSSRWPSRSAWNARPVTPKSSPRRASSRHQRRSRVPPWACGSLRAYAFHRASGL